MKGIFIFQFVVTKNSQMKKIIFISFVAIILIVGTCLIINRNNFKYFSLISSLIHQKSWSYTVDDSKYISKAFVKKYTIRARSNDDNDYAPKEVWIERQWFTPNLLGFICYNNKPDAYSLILKTDRVCLAYNHYHNFKSKMNYGGFRVFI